MGIRDKRNFVLSLVAIGVVLLLLQTVLPVLDQNDYGNRKVFNAMGEIGTFFYDIIRPDLKKG